VSASCQKLTVRTIPHTHLTSDIINFTSEVSSIATDILDSYVVSATPETDPVFTTWANTYSANYESTYNSYNTQSADLITYGAGDGRYVNLSGDVMTGGLSAPSLSTGTLYVGASTINFVDDFGNIINSLKSSDIDNYNLNYTIVSVNSAIWSSITESSANNISVYNTVNTNSADWIGGGSDVSSLSSNWENTYSTVGSYSATWGGGGSGGAYLPLSGGTMDHDAIISFDNYSRIRQNPNGSDNGIDLVCSIDYVHRWKDGFLYIYDQSNQIRTVYYGRDLIPGVNYDSSQGYIVGSVYVQDNGNSYICNDNSVGSAVWEIWNTVGNYLPLSGGTLIGAVSTTDILYTTGGNSNQWNNAYSTVQTNSANWNYQGTDIKSISSNWENTYIEFSTQSANNASVYSTVNTNSAVTWNYQGNDIKSISSNWENTYTQFSTQSSSNTSVFNTVNTNSAVNWNYQGTDIKSISSNWQNTYTGFSTQSANNISVYSTVQSNSSTWAIDSTTDTGVRALTSNWENTYSTVNANSASWTGGSTGGNYLPLSGGTVTGNVTVTGQVSAANIAANYIDFTPSSIPPTYFDGRLYYDTTERTLVFLDGDPTLTYPINKLLWVIGVNKTGSIIPKGTVVYLSGAQGNRGKMWPSLATSDFTSADTIGVTMQDTAINQEGYIITIGELEGIDTRNFAEGATLYLSPTTPGGITSTKPQAPNHIVKVGFSLNSTVNGKIYVEIDNGYELDELHDVRISSATDGQGLIYNSTSAIWVNSNLYDGTDVKDLTANWQNTYTNLSAINNVVITDVLLYDVLSWGGSEWVNRTLIYPAPVTVHNDLNYIQGGTTNEYYHLSLSDYNNTLSVYSTVQSNSATWTGGGGGSDVSGLSASWQNTYTSFSVQSANNASVYSTVNANSATAWNYQGTDVKSLTANWQNTYTNFSTQSANNTSVYSTVNANSATWGTGSGGTIDTGVRALTANWQNTYTSFSTQSANNISVYSTTNSNSANWLNDSYDEIWIGAGAMLSPTLSGATAATMPITATSNEIYIDSFTFDAASIKYTQFDVSLPSNCNKQSIKAKFSWTTTTSAAVGDVVWGIQARILSDTNTIDGGWGTAQECTDTISGNTTFQVSSATAVLGLSGTSSADALLLFRIFRDATDAADTLAVNASLYGVKLQYSLAGSLSSSW
jgi:hypothetical protein